MRGAFTLPATLVSKLGRQHRFVVLLLGDEELAVPFAEFPWFRSATIEQLSAVERPSENHLYWPQLDVDPSVESIRRPDAFPLISNPAP